MVKGKNILATAFLGIITIVIFASCTVAASNGNQTYLPIIEKPIPPTIEPPHITGNVVITTIYFDGSGHNEPDEYVDIRNGAASITEVIQQSGTILEIVVT